LKLVVCLLLLSCASLCPAQLSTQQKIDDFRSLAALYDKQYAPYEWKRDAFNFDALILGPWLTRVTQSKDDLDFYEICVEYVASLQDSHDVFTLPSSFVATLGFTTDVYDDKVLIDSIDRTRLRAANFPFQIGDEVASVDDKTAAQWIEYFWKFLNTANVRSKRRVAAGWIPVRQQSRVPRAHEIGDSAEVVIRRQGGSLETYKIDWLKSGLPLTREGPVPTLKASVSSRHATSTDVGDRDYLQPLLDLQTVRLPEEQYAVLGQGAINPIFSMPDGFVQRMGRTSTDNFFSGTYPAGGFRIGYIRIPSYSPRPASAGAQPDLDVALRQFETEIAFFDQNTDGLVVDDMRNPGGLVTYVEEIARRLIPYQFRTVGFEIRATFQFVRSISNSLASARQQGAPQYILNLLQAILKDVQTAFSENRGRTGPLPLGGSITLDLDPARVVYTKPLIVLVDDFSASGADMFAAVMQDNRRGPILGVRTHGAGGSVVDVSTGAYSEGATRITQTLMNRKNVIVTAEYPAAPYVENIGVRPDIDSDYMTTDNLLHNGKSFVDYFTSAIVDQITKQR